MKYIIFISILSIFLSGCSLTSMQKTDTPKTEIEIATQKAKDLFKEKQKEGIGLLDGPCLSNELMPDWVADIVHDPRQPIDDFPENQCSAISNGTAHHFVELDITGKFVRAQ
jgi:hypothetical protein